MHVKFFVVVSFRFVLHLFFFTTVCFLIKLMLFAYRAEGGELQSVLDRDEIPEEAVVVRFLRQVLKGLAFLHQHDIAHLDLKVIIIEQFQEEERRARKARAGREIKHLRSECYLMIQENHEMIR